MRSLRTAQEALSALRGRISGARALAATAGGGGGGGGGAAAATAEGEVASDALAAGSRHPRAAAALLAAARGEGGVGAEALLKPTKVRGVWRKPPIRPRVARQVRREFDAWGIAWPLVDTSAPKAHPYDRWLKGSRADVEGAEHRKTVEDKMRAMPKLVAEYRAARKAAREPKRGKEAEHIFDQLFTPPSVMRQRIKRAASRAATGGGK